VVAWATSMVNDDSSNFAEGKEKGYFLNNGSTLKWWHGHGAFIDYTNPEALEWWHRQLDQMFDAGVDATKTDGTDPYVYLFVLIRAHKGIITEREYADAYYRDFLNYAREKRGKEALIMARPADSFEIGGFDLFLDFAPKDCLTSGWVGDQDPTFDGLKHALRNMFRSANRGYANFGSDIGGYKGYHWPEGTDPRIVQLGRSKELFIRWVQLGAFNSLMENGGNGAHEPWRFDEVYNTNDTVNIYRKFVHIHMDLGPYLYEAGSYALETHTSVMHPMAYSAEFPSTYEYVLGKDIFVSPMLDESTSQRHITFPKGNDWVDWWDPSVVHSGGSKLDHYDCPMDRFPVFKRKGSMIAMNVTSAYSGGIHGDSNHKGHITFVISHPVRSTHRESARVRYLYTHGIEASYGFEGGHSMELTMSAHEEAPDVVFLIQGIRSLDSVEMIMMGAVNGEETIAKKVTQESELWEAEVGGPANGPAQQRALFFVNSPSEIKVRAVNNQAGAKLLLRGVKEM